MITALLLLLAAWPEPIDAAEAEGRPVMFSYADCIAREHRKLALVVVEFEPFRLSAADRLAAHRSACLTGLAAALRIDSSLFRFAVAEALLRRTHGKEAPGVADRAPLTHRIMTADAPIPADWASSGATVESWPRYRDGQRRYAVVSAIGDCVVRANPGNSWMVLRTKINSEEEVAAMRALQSAIGNCLMAGKQMSLTKNDIRGTLALNFYRLAKAPRATPGGTR